MTGNVGGVPEVGNATASYDRNSTFRHLPTHLQGVYYPYASSEYSILYRPLLPVKNNGVDEFCGNIKGFKSRLIAEPGENWQYGVSIDQAVEYLQRVAG
ncbi:BQ5605_C005g03202 [Microbotryum silenes-dioicae]|uniref:BQ5605_C005g03202 protein n=1 Tax=Microbotryum silenes-dioicae TaxID=796604 RepID=A0A2X0MA46_9BASI|nr:BQ5605_C005g03202 [Microbotryum silenes-dioicae]